MASNPPAVGQRTIAPRAPKTCDGRGLSSQREACPMRETPFMKSLFFGSIDESLVFPWPEPTTESERAAADRLNVLLDAVRRFFELRVDSKEIDRQRQIPSEVIAALRELGWFGMAIPQAYGGMGLSHTAYARAVQEMTGLDPSVAMTLRAHQLIGSRAIVLFGTEDQK